MCEHLVARSRSLAIVFRENLRDRFGRREVVGRAAMAIERLADDVQRQELALLQLLDRTEPFDERGFVPGHRATGLAGRRDQFLAQVVLDRRDRYSGPPRELADLYQLHGTGE